jgi:gentisate 1,2-dioxygenase
MGSSALDTKPQVTAERQEFYQRIDKKSATPLWEYLSELVTPEPRTPCVPAMWRYEEMRPLLMESGGLITAREAERRVLILENPGVRGASRITQSLYAGMQLVMPGETAPTHRHTASALRFVIESNGGYTAVDGERTTMHPGDFVVTPAWTYHDHGNPGAQPVIWMDVLDIPLVNILDASFAEHYSEEVQPVTKKEGDSLARFGANLLPVNYTVERKSTPIFSYPYPRTRETLDSLYRNGPVDPCHGVKMRFVNPATGGSPLPTIATFIQLLPSGFRGKAYRSTDATVYCVVEGSGRSQIGKNSFDWKRHDIFVVPSWCPVSHESNEETVLFSASDRPVQAMLGLWREEVPISA